MTLKTASIESIAVLHIGADWYRSVRTVLEAFYEKVVPGGFIILDDYGYWKEWAQALEDFLSKKTIKDVLIKSVGKVGAFFQKSVRNRLSEISLR